MKALTWQGKRDVRVEEVPDPQIQAPNDAIIKVTSTAICGSDLHLYEVLGAYLTPGDVLGHETMGVVEEVGPEVTHIKPGDRVVIPFNISCGSCWMCERGFYAQCETTQVRDQGKGATLFGYTSLYGAVPGGQAEYLRVPQAQFGPIKVPDEMPDTRFLYLSDILPTAWQGVQYADAKPGDTVAVIGLGPVGQFATRIAKQLGAERVQSLLPERAEPVEPGSGARERVRLQCVDAQRTVRPRGDQPGLAQHPQMPGCRGLGDPELVRGEPGQLPRRALARCQRLHEPTPHRISDGLQRIHAPTISPRPYRTTPLCRRAQEKRRESARGATFFLCSRAGRAGRRGGGG